MLRSNVLPRCIRYIVQRKRANRTAGGALPAQVTPSPVYPPLHVQVKDPSLS